MVSSPPLQIRIGKREEAGKFLFNWRCPPLLSADSPDRTQPFDPEVGPTPENQCQLSRMVLGMSKVVDQKFTDVRGYCIH